MHKSKNYYGCRFSPAALSEAYAIFLVNLGKGKNLLPQILSVTKNGETWHFDTVEEFIADCHGADSYTFDHMAEGSRFRVAVDGGEHYSRVHIEFSERAKIQAVFNVFETRLPENLVIVDEDVDDPIKVFIGHGRDPQWRDLKDHLHDQHGIEVVAYEVGPRAGRSVKEVLEGMLNESSFAIIVLTGEDQNVDGAVHARQNVVHELGLFQGHLGFTRAIALLEEGVEQFSNILGVNQIRFPKGGIRSTYGDILATIKREFADDD